MSLHHAFLIEARPDEGVRLAHEWVKRELKVEVQANPDVVTLSYGLLSVEEARRVSESVSGAPLVGEYKIVIITAERAYHEAQNALLKLFEEPPLHTFLFLILPSLGGILPTLRSRVQVQRGEGGEMFSEVPELVTDFLRASGEKRSALIKKLTSGKDDEARRENRDHALTLVNGLESILRTRGIEKYHATLADIATLRGYLYDRSAPVKLILEHLSLVIPSEVR